MDDALTMGALSLRVFLPACTRASTECIEGHALSFYVSNSRRYCKAPENSMMSRRELCKGLIASTLATGVRAILAQPNLPCIQEENNDYLTTQILTYIGNKRALLKHIGEQICKVRHELNREKLSFFDAFSGSGIVARYMKQYASMILTNDMERYSEIINRCYLTNSNEIDSDEFDDVYQTWVKKTFDSLEPGIITKLYAPKDDMDIKEGERVFYTRKNAMILDTARKLLDEVVPSEFRELLLAPLLAEASIHSNTSGVFKGFYKNRQGIGAFGGEGRNALARICGEVKLQKPVLSNFNCQSKVYRGDTNLIVKNIPDVDLAYFDPPYNQHPYGSNYFMLNVLAENKEPENISRVSGIPSEWNHSKYNSKNTAEETFFELLTNTRSKYLLISYNSEGFITHDRFMKFLETLGEVESTAIEYNTFRGSRNLRQRALKVDEYLFLVRKV